MTRPVVILLAGASGSGKSRLSYPLADHLGAALVEVDDLVVAVRAVTDSCSHPDLHYWSRHDSSAMTPDAIVRGQIALARALEPALSAVIDNHLDTATPVVVDGDYIVPGSVVHPAVRSVVVHEDDVQQLTTNYLAREPEMGDQRERAEASVAYGRWLAGEARRHAIPVLPARPWATAFDRLLTALDLTTTSAS